MTVFIQKTGKSYYLVEESRIGQRKKKRKYLRRVTEEDAKEFEKNKKVNSQLVQVTCSNPKCDRTIPMTRQQKQKFFTTFPLRYGRFNLPYCSKECRERHWKELAPLRKRLKPATSG